MRSRSSLLVVDDDPRNRRLLARLLAAEGHDVREAEDGPAALAEATRRPPDLVLLDVMMPGISGLEVCAELKRRPATRTTQVMLVTALDGADDLVAGLDCGADDHVAKPIRRDVVLAKVRALLRVRSLLRDLEDARRELAERNDELELKRTLAETLVHDLKNPLAAILGNLELLARKADAAAHPLIRRSRAAADLMQSMIVDLLDVARLEAGGAASRRERLDLAELARLAVAHAGPAAAARGLSLRLVAPPTAMMVGEPALCRRVLDHLVENALARTPAGGSIEVRIDPGRGQIVVGIADPGPDVPARLRDHIFDTCRRADRGLGLALCRLTAEAHGGAAWVDEAPGGGARFLVRFPAAAAATADDDRPALTA